MMPWHRNGSSFVEVTWILAVLMITLVVMSTYLQRGVQGGLKASVDGVGHQFDHGGQWESLTRRTQTTIDNVIYSGQCTDATYRIGSVSSVAANCTAPEAEGFDSSLVN